MIFFSFFKPDTIIQVIVSSIQLFLIASQGAILLKWYSQFRCGVQQYETERMYMREDKLFLVALV